ncbi:hypothetical protein [Thalassotalea sp. PLHSN55]|uniref:hypothetical protein n=1 Tax=Thalassotalea sp. PLHSN55 TaxID=3435888 RepID=UPI003F85C3F4
MNIKDLYSLLFKGERMSQAKGFIVSIIAVITVFVISAVAGGMLADLAGVWKKPFIGSFAAFCVVLTGYFTAPKYKQTAAAIWLAVGAIAAWYLSNTSPYPEDKPTLIPLYATYASGIVALVICMLWHKKRENRGR